MGYLQYHYQGRGIVKTGKNLFLLTGGWLHKGLELIGLYLKGQQAMKLPAKEVSEEILLWIIQQVKQGYFAEVFPKGWQEKGGGFDLSDEIIDEWTKEKRQLTAYEQEQLQQYTFNEQTALIEGLLRVFCLKVVPVWMEKYSIVAVEKDMSFPFVSGKGWEVIQSAKVDWVLQQRDNKDLYLVSFKGYRTFGNHEAKQASHDTQGLSESWAFDRFLETKQINKKIMGVKMLYLIKGARKETKRGNGVYEQNSPLIRGYRRLTEDGPEYAHSWFYPKLENDSGVGALGKSWDKFDVFQGQGLEEVGGVKGWIELIQEGMQEECESPLETSIVEPEPYLRHEIDVVSWERQTKAREQEIAFKLMLEEQYRAAGDDGYLDDCFPQNRQACHYYPGGVNDCPYIPVCHGTIEERMNPLENGYEFRKPHHEAERLYQIEKGMT